MATSICITEEFNVVQGTLGPTTTNGAITTGDYVSLKNALRCTILVSLNQAATDATAITIEQATNVAGAGSTAITNVVPIWQNVDVSSTDTNARQTDAVSDAATAGTNPQLFIFQVDPTTLAAGFDCITCKLADSTEATNFVNITYLIQTTRGQATPPSAIID
jgi:hypothetical protein